MKRVLVLNHFAAPRDAPGGTRHIELCQRFERWQARIIAANRNYLTGQRHVSSGIYNVVPTLPYKRNGLSRVLNWVSYALVAPWSALRGPKPDIVYASSPHLLTGLTGLLVARIRRASFVLEVRDVWPQVLIDVGGMPERSRLIRALEALERFLYRRAQAIVVVSAGMRSYLISRGASPDKLRVIPNGADPDDFVPPYSREELRKRYGVKEFAFVYAGAHGSKDGLDAILRTAFELLNELPHLEFFLVGDGPVKEELVRTADRQGLRNVRFLAPVPKKEMAALLGAMDVALHTVADIPLFEAALSPNKLMDYMAAGMPVITNAPGEGAALVEEAGAGIAVRTNELTQAVRKAVEAGPEQRARWGEKAREHIAKHRSRRGLAQQLEEILDEVVEP